MSEVILNLRHVSEIILNLRHVSEVILNLRQPFRCHDFFYIFKSGSQWKRKVNKFAKTHYDEVNMNVKSFFSIWINCSEDAI